MTLKRSIVFPGSECSPVLQSSQAWADVLVLERHLALPADQDGLCSEDYLLLLHLDICRLGLRFGAQTRWTDAAAGSISIVGDGARLEWLSGETGPLLAAAIRPMFVASVAGRVGIGIGPLRSGTGLSEVGIAHVLQALGAELARDCPAGRVHWMALATALAAQLLRLHVVGPPEASLFSGGLAPRRLQRVLDHIHTHLHEELCVPELARIADLSPSHFAVAFRKSTGTPPYRYAMHRRALRAKEMLADPERSIADIAYTLGYSSQAHFTTMFRRMTGTSPGAYRASIVAEPVQVFAESLNDHGSV